MTGAGVEQIEEQVDCLYCGRPAATFWFAKGAYPVFRCGACKSGFVWPRPQQAEIDAYYQSLSYAGQEDTASVLAGNDNFCPNVTTGIRRIVDPIRKLARGDRFLDVGAGNGQCALEAARQGFQVSACEPNPNSRAIFRDLLGFDADPDLFDADYAARHAGGFDVAFLSQVLEHIVAPDVMAANLHTVLAPGGIAAIGVPHFGSALSRLQGKGDMFISPPEHLNYFSRAGLTALMARHGFELERFDTVTVVPRTGKFKLLGPPIYATLRLAEAVGKGMVIQACFRKK